MGIVAIKSIRSHTVYALLVDKLLGNLEANKRLTHDKICFNDKGTTTSLTLE